MTVIIIIIVLMVLLASIMSSTVTQANISQKQIDRIKAEEVAKGAYWIVYDNRRNNRVFSTSIPTASSNPITLDGKSYNPTANDLGAGGGPLLTQGYRIDVTY